MWSRHSGWLNDFDSLMRLLQFHAPQTGTQPLYDWLRLPIGLQMAIMR